MASTPKRSNETDVDIDEGNKKPKTSIAPSRQDAFNILTFERSRVRLQPPKSLEHGKRIEIRYTDKVNGQSKQAKFFLEGNGARVLFIKDWNTVPDGGAAVEDDTVSLAPIPIGRPKWSVLMGLTSGNGDWITFHEDFVRAILQELVSREDLGNKENIKNVENALIFFNSPLKSNAEGSQTMTAKITTNDNNRLNCKAFKAGMEGDPVPLRTDEMELVCVSTIQSGDVIIAAHLTADSIFMHPGTKSPIQMKWLLREIIFQQSTTHHRGGGIAPCAEGLRD